MATRDKKDIEKALLKKGFKPKEGDHNYFIYYTQEGKKTNIKTKTSHTPKMRVIGNGLLSQMAKQCHLNTSEFLDLIDCPMSQDKYESVLGNKKVL